MQWVVALETEVECEVSFSSVGALAFFGWSSWTAESEFAPHTEHMLVSHAEPDTECETHRHAQTHKGQALAR